MSRPTGSGTARAGVDTSGSAHRRRDRTVKDGGERQEGGDEEGRRLGTAITDPLTSLGSDPMFYQYHHRHHGRLAGQSLAAGEAWRREWGPSPACPGSPTWAESVTRKALHARR